ncbi:G-type lectin S-receptor-like serine/threonine-protein kinase [Camellia lanceoleosa]|uniref:G-type lectin S-receptor-like serine/threonine-protein kinase n=1 Tax=Camellia lanceoleosa TaxID=1840588 RepID=A0ACC0H2W5_9ERIC|nr:G-type lectin S-receptor-like serine/threonine-protein kinase [Camellia lanceoleosa]
MRPVMKENGAYTTTTTTAAAAVIFSYNFHSTFTPPSSIFIIFGILLLLGPLIFCLAAAATTARDTITPGNPIRDNYSETLISAGSKFQLEPRDKCSVYNACGDFGICNSENSGLKYCKCLPGFDPTSPDEWNSGEFSSGCTRKTTTCLTDKKQYTFLKLKIMTVEDPPGSLPEAISEEHCKNECVKDCNCLAYSFIASSVAAQRVTSTNSSECITWTSNPRNLREDTEGAQNLSVRVARTDIESTSRDCEPCGANILPYPLRTGQNCGDPMYNNFRCNKSTGQVEFQEPSGIYRVTSIDPDNLRFIIQLTDTVKNADICRSKNFRVSPSLPYKVIGSSCNAGLAVEISWDPAPMPTCTSLEDCKDWPNSSCNTTEDGKRRCLCNANYQWHGLELNCTSVLGNDNSTRKKKKSFSFVIHFMVAMILVVLICIGGYIWYKRRKLKQRQESRESVQRNQALRLFDTERRVKNLIDSVADGKFKHRSRSLIAIAAAAISAGLLLISSFGYVLRMRRLRSQGITTSQIRAIY